MCDNEMPSAEYCVIAKMQTVLRNQPSGYYTTGIGDDAAVRTDSNGNTLIITTDLSVEHIHFSLDYMTMQEVGFRAMVSNLSDCAAMGALPDSAFIQLVVPEDERSFTQKIEALYQGFAEACTTWQFPVVGGDISRGKEWIVGITLIGRIEKAKKVLLRTGMQPGDKVFVSGIPGRSAAGLYLLQHQIRDTISNQYCALVNAHLRPIPRIGFGMHLAEDPEVHAVMDLSDGLSKDCRTLCHENDCRINLYANPSHLPGEMLQLSRETGIPWHKWYFHGGEDYELLFTATRDFKPQLYPECLPICIGECSDGGADLMVVSNGISSPLVPEGYDHFDVDLK